MFIFPPSALDTTKDQDHHSPQQHMMSGPQTTTMTPTIKCESEESLSPPTDKGRFRLPSSSGSSQQKLSKRTKAMWDAGVTAVNAYMETGEDYVTRGEREEFSFYIEEMRSSAETTAAKLRRFAKPAESSQNDVHGDSEDVDKPGHDNGDFEERIVNLEYSVNQERLKRKRLEEDFETFRRNTADVLAESTHDIVELRALTTARTPSERSIPAASPRHTGSTADKPFSLETHKVKRLKTDGLDMTGFSWDQTLDKTQLIDPADDFAYLLPDYPELKAMVLAAVSNLAPITLSNRSKSCAGLWQCLLTRAKGDGGMFRGTYVPPAEACAKCSAAGRFCLAFKIGLDPVNAETKLLPLPEGMGEGTGFGEEDYFKVGAA